MCWPMDRLSSAPGWCPACRGHADDEHGRGAGAQAPERERSCAPRSVTATCSRNWRRAAGNWAARVPGHLLVLDRHTSGDGIVSALQILQAVRRQRPRRSSTSAGRRHVVSADAVERAPGVRAATGSATSHSTRRARQAVEGELGDERPRADPRLGHRTRAARDGRSRGCRNQPPLRRAAGDRCGALSRPYFFAASERGRRPGSRHWWRPRRPGSPRRLRPSARCRHWPLPPSLPEPSSGCRP